VEIIVNCGHLVMTVRRGAYGISVSALTYSYSKISQTQEKKGKSGYIV
jgi:hypothetical protein